MDFLSLNERAGCEENRKNSNSDLHSRLKTRKILGVGEVDDGDVHKSKISQILGHSEHLYVKCPKGLAYLQLFNLALLLANAIVALALPSLLAHFEFGDWTQTDGYRMYGAVLASYVFLYQSLAVVTDRYCVRALLMSTAVLYGLQCIICFFYVRRVLFLLRLAGVAANLFYCEQIGPSLVAKFMRKYRNDFAMGSETSPKSQPTPSADRKAQ